MAAMQDEMGPKSVTVLVTWDANDHGGNVHFEVCCWRVEVTLGCVVHVRIIIVHEHLLNCAGLMFAVNGIPYVKAVASTAHDGCLLCAQALLCSEQAALLHMGG
jgi:hypothetical protein